MKSACSALFTLGLFFSAFAHAIDLKTDCVSDDGLSAKSGYFAGGDGPILYWQEDLVVSRAGKEIMRVRSAELGRTPTPYKDYFYKASTLLGTTVEVALDSSQPQRSLEEFYWVEHGFLTLKTLDANGETTVIDRLPVKCFTDGRDWIR